MEDKYINLDLINRPCDNYTERPIYKTIGIILEKDGRIFGVIECVTKEFITGMLFPEEKRFKIINKNIIGK